MLISFKYSHKHDYNKIDLVLVTVFLTENW